MIDLMYFIYLKLTMIPVSRAKKFNQLTSRDDDLFLYTHDAARVVFRHTLVGVIIDFKSMV